MSWRLVRVASERVRVRVPKIQGKQRPRSSRAGGVVRTYTPRQTEEAEALIRGEWLARVGTRWASWDGEVWVALRFTRELARSNPATWEGRGDRGKPDIDNAAKLVLDALNGTAWRDDSQVTLLEASKMPRTRYGGGCAVEIRVTYLREEYEEER